MKHTPGPWNTVSLSGERIAIVAHDATDIGNLSHATAANARLIAAAPELLAALQAIVEEAGPLYGHDDGMGCINRMARIARAAIARAIGEA